MKDTPWDHGLRVTASKLRQVDTGGVTAALVLWPLGATPWRPGQAPTPIWPASPPR
jgi:hypothetical protein